MRKHFEMCTGFKCSHTTPWEAKGPSNRNIGGLFIQYCGSNRTLSLKHFAIAFNLGFAKTFRVRQIVLHVRGCQKEK